MRRNLYNKYLYTGDPKDVSEYRKKKHKKSKAEENIGQGLVHEEIEAVVQVKFYITHSIFVVIVVI